MINFISFILGVAVCTTSACPVPVEIVKSSMSVF